MGVQQTVSEYKILYKENPTWTSSANHPFFNPLPNKAERKALSRGLENALLKTDILDVLEIRFDLRETDPLSARISAIEDLQRLKQLLRAAVQVSSLEAFQHLLDE